MTGGKWTTCRQMGQDAVDRAAVVGGLPTRPCQTAALTLLCQGTGGPSDFLDPDLPYQMHEIDSAVVEDMALTLDDVLSRRTRAAFLDEAATMRCAPKVAARMAALLGRDEAWVRAEVEAIQGVPTSQIASVVEVEGS